MLLYISRLFVEFGPFEANEIQSFIQRGLLSETDYLRVQGEEDWMHISDWTPPFTYQPSQKTAVKKAAPRKAIPAHTKKAPAKKVSVKKATAKKALAKKTLRSSLQGSVMQAFPA
jgi:hypothetical protein